jgi:hypothetical protein
MKLISIKKSPILGKKLRATFRDPTGKISTTDFGASGYSDFTINRDPKRRAAYIARHSNESWTDPTTAGTLSRFILWEHTSIRKAISTFKKNFNL